MIIVICRIVRMIDECLMEVFVSLAVSISLRIKSCMISEKRAVIVLISSRDVSFAVTLLPPRIWFSSILMLLSSVVQARKATSSFCLLSRLFV